MKTKPNILWYCSDQQRYDTINILGNKFIETPNINSLISSGVAFTRAYAQSPICTSSRASFLTGRYPASHHVYRNGNEYFPPSEKLITKILSENDYLCGLVGKLHIAGAQHNIENRTDDGYNSFDWSHHPYPDIQGNEYSAWLKNEKKVDPDELFDSIKGSYGPGAPADLHQTTWCTEKSIQFIEKNKNKNWCLTVNPFAPHPTFHPPKEYLKDHSNLPYPMFKDTDIEHQIKFKEIDQQSKDSVNPYEYDGKFDKENAELPWGERASIPPRNYDSKYIKACYYGEIEFLDFQFGRIINYLKENYLYEDTIIIFMSDHGELLGDHGLLYKGCRFFDSLVRVPLIFSCPNILKKNYINNDLVELIDVTPTILDLCNLEIPENIQGISMKNKLVNSEQDDFDKKSVISEYNDAAGGSTIKKTKEGIEGSRGSMYFDGQYKLNIYHNHNLFELYDLENDPNEFDNLWYKEGYTDLKHELTIKHFKSFVQTVDGGIRRTKDY